MQKGEGRQNRKGQSRRGRRRRRRPIKQPKRVSDDEYPQLRETLGCSLRMTVFLVKKYNL
jgi:hypothetical protein